GVLGRDRVSAIKGDEGLPRCPDRVERRAARVLLQGQRGLRKEVRAAGALVQRKGALRADRVRQATSKSRARPSRPASRAVVATYIRPSRAQAALARRGGAACAGRWNSVASGRTVVPDDRKRDSAAQEVENRLSRSIAGPCDGSGGVAPAYRSLQRQLVSRLLLSPA